MGVETAVIGGLVGGAGLLSQAGAKKPKSAADLEKKADKKAELKRLARGYAQQTTLTSPRGVAGMGLKKKLGQ